MLVYADAKHRADPRALLRALIDHAAKLPSVAEPERHEALTSLLLDAGELAQGLIDAEQQRAGLDELTLLTEAATAMVRAVAEAFVADGWVDALQLRALARLALPEQVSISRPEGFAFYATYPCAWARAARRFVKRETRVIGIRSIGLTLAAVVAAAARARQLVSVRPIGHPFARELAIGPALAQRLLERGSQATYLIVDEGPGLSGSSFASVAQWLREHGVAADRIVLMPSHAGFSSRARSRNEAVSGYCELSATPPSAKRPSEATRRITPRTPSLSMWRRELGRRDGPERRRAVAAPRG